MFVVNFEQIPQFALLFVFDVGHGEQMIARMVGCMSGFTFSQGILHISVVKSCFSKCKAVTKKENFCHFYVS